LLKNIRRLCLERDVSVADVERTLGFGDGTIYKWRKSSPRLSSILLVAEYFGVTVDELVHGPNKPDSAPTA